MPSFTKGPTYRQPFGRNVFLRSTDDVKAESKTVASSTVPAETIDGIGSQKILQAGTVLAKITSGVDVGKVGPFQGSIGANEVQTLTRTSTGGTVTLTFRGETTPTIPATAAGFTASAVQAALESTTAFSPAAGDAVVAGAAGGPLTVTFSGRRYEATDVPQLVVDNTLATGGTVTVATTTAGVAAGSGGPTDGRGDPNNIVGLNNTFLPWQLMDRDVEVANLYECTAYQIYCIELDASGARVPLSDATADAMRGKKGLNILFK